MVTERSIPTPSQFDFASTVKSHGWCDLLPFEIDRNPLRLHHLFRTPSGRMVRVSIVPGSLSALNVRLEHSGTLSAADSNWIAGRLAEMFHFSLDLEPFFARMRREKQFTWIARKKAGRFLRGETFFEDVLKVILTTNCSWGLTRSMNARLIDLFGKRDKSRGGAFPTPESIAGSSERFLREHAKLGYRAPYILEFSQYCAKGWLDIESFRSKHAPASELYPMLRSIKGVGEYAAGTLLKLLGRYEYLALDSWCRSAFAELHGGGSGVTDRDIERHYAPYEEWKGLVLWLDLTKHWYSRKFPL